MRIEQPGISALRVGACLATLGCVGLGLDRSGFSLSLAYPALLEYPVNPTQSWYPVETSCHPIEIVSTTQT